MTKHYRNHNIRFNMTDEGGVGGGGSQEGEEREKQKK